MSPAAVSRLPPYDGSDRAFMLRMALGGSRLRDVGSESSSSTGNVPMRWLNAS